MTALQNIAGNNTQGAITTGTFEFDEDTMRQLVSEWLSLAEDYEDSLNRTVTMVQIEGPGLDFASESHAEAANASGSAYLAYLRNNRDYCLQQAQLFQNALHDYLGIEHTNVTQIGDAGQPLEPGPKTGI
jgi:hypothetical protein